MVGKYRDEMTGKDVNRSQRRKCPPSRDLKHLTKHSVTGWMQSLGGVNQQ